MSAEVIGVQEYSSIAAGVLALDALVKAAPVEVLAARIVTPGRLVVLFTGDVASVEASLAAGRQAGDDALVDELFVPNLHPLVIPAIRAVVAVREGDALGIIESLSVTAGIEAADAAAKEAAVEIPEIRLAGGMGGKSTVKLMGSLRDVQAALRAGVERVQAGGKLCRQVVIARPHPDIRSFVLPDPGKAGALWS